MDDVELARIASAPARRSRSAKSAAFTSTSSSTDSCTHSAPCSASSNDTLTSMRERISDGATSGAMGRAAAAACRTRSCNDFRTSACRAKTRTSHPARAKTSAHELPMIPAPTIATRRRSGGTAAPLAGVART